MLITISALHEGFVRQAGVGLSYQVFGNGGDTILLLPDWPVVNSDAWRRQVVSLSRRHTVVTFDGRGSGASDRPTESIDYSLAELVEDARAILDAAEIQRAAVISAGDGAAVAALLASAYPERVTAAVFIGATLPIVPDEKERADATATFNDVRDRYEGWGKWNRHFWRRDWWSFLEFYVGACFPEPGSEVDIQQFLAMGLEISPSTVETLIDAPSLNEEDARHIASSVGCPSLVLHGEADVIAPLQKGIELAKLVRAGLHVLPGAGHHSEHRHAEQTSGLIELFLDRALRLTSR